MITGDDREMFAAGLRRATETTTGPALDAALDDIGWRDALEADRRTAVSLLFGLQGAAGATSNALDRVLGDALGLDRTTPVLFPPIGATTPPGVVAESGFDVRGIASSAAEGVDQIVVVVTARDAGPAGWARVGIGDLALRPVSGMDAALDLVEVSGEGVVVEVEPLHPDAWNDAVAVAQLALAHELIGASRAMLALARDHAVERIQFGQPIAQFQAVRHRLADTYVAIESAEAAVDAAWDDGSPLAAAVAKAVAGRNARLAARHCQQVLAGIGFTAEHSFHGYLRRVLVLERLFGDARSLTVAVGEQLLRTRQVPSLLPL